jgi:hypothetical protein
MTNVYLCGRGKCCPYVHENVNDRTVTIIDGKKKIKFKEDEIENLRVYLNQRHG